MEEPVKICSKCKAAKLISCFYVRKSGRESGKARQPCIQCHSYVTKDYWFNRGGKENKKKYNETHGLVLDRIKQQRAMARDPLYIQKKLARYAVYNATRKGMIQKASDFSCTDCGVTANEYDHYLGYDENHWFDVEPVCFICHNKRTRLNARKV